MAATRRNFTGQYLDQTGLLFYNARYYDPAIGRFVSADPIGIDRTNSQTRNRYSYVLNNPLKFTDPTGHCYNPYDEPTACENAEQVLSDHGIVLDDINNWSLEELLWVIESIRDLRYTAGWTVDDFKTAMGVTSDRSILLERGGYNKEFSAYHHGWTITMYDGAFTNGKDWAKRTMVHELGHQWDTASQLLLSTDLVHETGGNTGLCIEHPSSGSGTCVGYQPGDYNGRPSLNDYYVKNKYEDFAEPVAATVYGSDNPNYANSIRDKYIREKFAENAKGGATIP